MKHTGTKTGVKIGTKYTAAILFMLACLIYSCMLSGNSILSDNNTVFAEDKAKDNVSFDRDSFDMASFDMARFNMVFSTHGDYSYAKGDKDYRIENIKELYQTDKCGTEKYYSARVEYRKTAYSEAEIIDVIKEAEGFVTASKDEIMHADAVPSSNLDPFMTRQWYLNSIGAYDAWDIVGSSPGDDIVVAVVDSGVNYVHGDLIDNMWINESELYGVDGMDDDGNGVTDDICGASFNAEDMFGETVSGDPYDTDTDAHGTHVAGIIAMAGGNGGGRGVAYGAKIMAVKAGGSDGSFLVSDVISAVNYAVNMGADVINMSFGATQKSEVLEQLLEKASKNSILVAAAGNEQTSTDTSKMYPAAYPFVIGVMAEDENGNIPYWSNYDTGSENRISYDIAAPGVDIYSTVFDDSYKYLSGTSMAAPMVSAAAAVLFRDALENGRANPVKYAFGQIVNSSADTAVYTDGRGNAYTYPTLNIYDALVTKPSLNMNVCGYSYMEKSTGAVSSDHLYPGNEKTYIYCGYDIQNRWSAAKNVKVNITVDSPVCRVVKGESTIGSIAACDTASISCSSSRAPVIELNGVKGNTYEIPVNYTITGLMSDGSGETVTQTFDDVLKVSISSNLTGSPKTAKTTVAAVKTEVSTVPDTKKPAKVKNLRVYKKIIKGKYARVGLKWKKADGAKKYVIYYSSKKNGRFKKLAVRKNNRFVHKFNKYKRYYYRVRAYAGSTKSKIYGKYSNTVRG